MLRKFTDIRFDGWIAAMPKKWQGYIHLARLDRPIGIWLLLLPGWWSIFLASGANERVSWFETLFVLLLFFIGAVVMRAAGCVINDLWDRDIDAKVERTALRPIPSGAVSVKQAFLFLLGLLAFGFIILLQLNVAAIILGLVCVPLVIAYPLMKRFTFWPQAFLGLTFNFGALIGWAAIDGRISMAALLLYAGGILWTLGYDTIYAHQDKDDDALIGVRSTALKFGEKSKLWVGGFYGLAALIFTLSFWGVGYGVLPSIGCFTVIAAHFIWQLWRWDMDDQQSCLRVFKSNRDFGFLMLLLCFYAFIGL
ncbi:MAG: 4-hydroxybenzoate octaprenyltransferase [Micavibrio sp.]|nr:4-hydroxybenzoate octaprenyltransferase [Micavibrio sp.]